MKNQYFTMPRKVGAIALQIGVPYYKMIAIMEEKHRKTKMNKLGVVLCG